MIVARVEVDASDRLYRNIAVNPDNQPTLFYDKLRYSRWLEDITNGRVNIFYNAAGCLAHGDIKAIRRANLTMLYADRPYHLIQFLQQDNWVRVISDGSNVRIVQERVPAICIQGES